MFDISSLKEIEILKENERQKVILTQSPDGRKYLKRVLSGDKREIYKSLEKIDHLSIPKIYYISFDSDTIIIEEYIDGITLSDFIEQGKKLDKKQLHSVVKQLLSALETLHKGDIIHRDIKPDNILIDESNHIWLTDYDISRIYRKEVRRDTETMGTFGYAPIEQYGMLPTDFKTDIYALGVTLKTLLDYLNVKGFLYKVAEKCKKLDPEERYKNIKAIKRVLIMGKIIPYAIMLFLVLALTSGIILESLTKDVPESNIETSVHTIDDKAENETSEETDKKTDVQIKDTNDKKSNDKDVNELSDKPSNEVLDESLEEFSEIIRFVDFDLTEKQIEYSRLENFNTTPIFSGEEIWQYIPFMEDMKTSGTILLGKNHSTPVKANADLKNGIFSISLKDELGHSFSKDFYFDGNHTFNIIYPNNRRINAEMVCRDLDGDGIEELLIGLCDCSMIVTQTSIYQYFNYSIGWVLKYDEARGFILCEGDMFSENSKLIFIENDLRVHLPYAAANTEDKDGYKLDGNRIVPFIM